jgi:hypothetical protein
VYRICALGGYEMAYVYPRWMKYTRREKSMCEGAVRWLRYVQPVFEVAKSVTEETEACLIWFLSD